MVARNLCLCVLSLLAIGALGIAALPDFDRSGMMPVPDQVAGHIRGGTYCDWRYPKGQSCGGYVPGLGYCPQLAAEPTGGNPQYGKEPVFLQCLIGCVYCGDGWNVPTCN